MTERWFASALIAVAVAAPASALAEPAFDTFKSMCLDTSDHRASLTVAEAHGWKPIPKDQLASFPTLGVKGASQSTIEGRVDGVIGSAETLKGALMVGHAGQLNEKYTTGADFCIVATHTADAPALNALVAQYAGVSPNAALFTLPNTTAFAWRETGGKRIPVAGGDLEKDFAPGDRILVATTESGIALMGLLTPTK